MKIDWKTVLISFNPAILHFPSRDTFVIRHHGTLAVGNICTGLGQKLLMWWACWQSGVPHLL